MARLYRVIMPVSDIEAAAKFYGAILDAPGKRVSPGRHYFDCEGTILACYDPIADGDSHRATPNPDHIYLAVDDIESAYAKCSSVDAKFMRGSTSGTPLGKIAKRPWGERSFYLHDPFGNPVCFVERATMFTG
jgi:catechol 2,3-dioxygenase-like lactoylglutathione lyase family enzyme